MENSGREGRTVVRAQEPRRNFGISVHIGDCKASNGARCAGTCRATCPSPPATAGPAAAGRGPSWPRSRPGSCTTPLAASRRCPTAALLDRTFPLISAYIFCLLLLPVCLPLWLVDSLMLVASRRCPCGILLYKDVYQSVGRSNLSKMQKLQHNSNQDFVLPSQGLLRHLRSLIVCF